MLTLSKKFTHAFPITIALLFPMFYIDYSKTQTVNLLLAVLFVGVFVFAARIFVNRSYLKSTFSKFFVLLLCSLLVTDIINRDAFLWSNLRDLLYLAVLFFVVYPFDYTEARKAMLLKLSVFCNVIVYFAFAGAAFSIFTFLFKFNLSFPEYNYYIGMHENRLWGIVNPNTGSFIALIALFLSGILFYTNRKRKRSLYMLSIGAAAVCNAVYIVLANSRASLLAMLAGVLVAVFLLARRFARGSHSSRKTVRAVAAGAAAMMICTGFYFASRPVFSVLPGLMIRKGHETTNTVKIEPPKAFVVDLSRIDQPDVSSNRYGVWGQGLNLWSENRFWGISQRKVTQNVKIWNNVNHLHNDYLNVLASGGIAAAAIVLGMAAWYLYKIWRYFFCYADKNLFYAINAIITGLIFAIAVNCVFECYAFLTVNSYNVVLFSLLSFQMYSIKKYEATCGEGKKTRRHG